METIKQELLKIGADISKEGDDINIYFLENGLISIQSDSILFRSSDSDGDNNIHLIDGNIFNKISFEIAEDNDIVKINFLLDDYLEGNIFFVETENTYAEKDVVDIDIVFIFAKLINYLKKESKLRLRGKSL